MTVETALPRPHQVQYQPASDIVNGSKLFDASGYVAHLNSTVSKAMGQKPSLSKNPPSALCHVANQLFRTPFSNSKMEKRGNKMLDALQRPTVLVASFIAGVAAMIGFQMWTPLVGGEILDRLSTREEISSILNSMTGEQKINHFWMTLVLDSVFPIFYGAFFGGLALVISKRFGVLLALPALLVVIADFAENIVQLILLNGEMSVLGAKHYLTPIKYGLFYTALLIALISLMLLAFNAIRSRFS